MTDFASQARELHRWKVTLEVISDLKPTELAIMVNMFPGVIDAFVIKSEKSS